MFSLRHLACAALTALPMALCINTEAATRTVEYPWINFSNNSTIDLAKVEITDTNTVLTVNAYYPPKYWIRMAGKSYLRVGGKKYAIKGSEGIKLDDYFWMPESGQASFILIFEPLPEDTIEFDFIEGEGPDFYQLYGVELAEKEYRSLFPTMVIGETKDVEIPAPVFEMGRTTVNFHLLPFRAEIPTELTVFINNISGAQDEHNVKIDENGKGILSFDQYGTVNAILVPEPGRLSTRITLQPGETIDCYLDMRMTGIQAMQHRKGFSRDMYQRIAHTGIYNDLNRLVARNSAKYRMNLYTGEFADYQMSGAEYKNMVKTQYEALRDSIAQSEGPQMWKEYQLLGLQNDVLEAMANYGYLLEHNYRNVHDKWNPDYVIPEDSITATLTPDDYAEVATWFDLNNPKLLLCDSHLGDLDWNQYGVKGDLSKSLNLYADIAEKASETKLEQADLEKLKALSNPFFAAACDSINQRTIRELQKLTSVSAVMPTPETDAENVFDAIIASHKGKVVVVDLWNTWCGPCRAALKHHEPLKSGELRDKDIVWIYIADESSDPVKYLQLLPDIKGLHYKLTEEQIRAVGKRFGVDGIPYYILVDREGNATGRPDMRADGTFVKAIREKL